MAGFVPRSNKSMFKVQMHENILSIDQMIAVCCLMVGLN